jgi:hypothetical protein
VYSGVRSDARVGVWCCRLNISKAAHARHHRGVGLHRKAIMICEMFSRGVRLSAQKEGNNDRGGECACAIGGCGRKR